MYSPPECKALSSLLSLLPLNPEGRSFLEVFFLFLPKLYIRYLYRFFVVVSIFFFFKGKTAFCKLENKTT